MGENTETKSKIVGLKKTQQLVLYSTYRASVLPKQFLWQGLYSVVCPCSILLNADGQARKEHVPFNVKSGMARLGV